VDVSAHIRWIGELPSRTLPIIPSGSSLEALSNGFDWRIRDAIWLFINDEMDPGWENT